MKSRYCAYAARESRYIIRTTHPDNPDYSIDIKSWKKSIDDFCKDTGFMGLEIIEFIDGENEAFVTFKAILSSRDILERSRFLLVDNEWLYESGDITL